MVNENVKDEQLKKLIALRNLCLKDMSSSLDFVTKMKKLISTMKSLTNKCEGKRPT